MGFLWSANKRLLQLVVVFYAVSYFPGVPPHLDFVSEEIPQFLPLLGSLKVNDRLNNADHMFEGQIHGPESIVHKDGAMYTGVHGGEIVEIKGGRITTLLRIGKKCDNLQENGCGRILGLKIGPDGFLYAADAYLGIYKVDIKTKKATNLVSNSDSIGGKTPALFNSVDVAKDGSVFWTISSSDFPLHDLLLASITKGTGKLVKYDPKKKTNQVLIDNMLFANGVSLSKNEDFVIVCDGMRSRILRYYLKGQKAGTQDVFIEGLPGLLDNIQPTSRGTFYVALVAPSEQHDVHFIHKVFPYPNFRKFVSRILYCSKLFFQQIDKLYPNYFSKAMDQSLANFGIMRLFFTRNKRVSLVELNENGDILRSFHATDGSVAMPSDFSEVGGNLYIGSPFTDYIGKVKIRD